MTLRFTGTVDDLGPVDHTELAAWIEAIPFTEWPQQHLRSAEPIRPAMVTDLAWRGFGGLLAPVIAQIMPLFPGRGYDTVLLSVVMPGQSIEPHVDQQPPHWYCRVHVPLLSNAESLFIVGGVSHHLELGRAYMVNTELVHSVVNLGGTPRVHTMFDLKWE